MEVMESLPDTSDIEFEPPKLMDIVKPFDFDAD